MKKKRILLLVLSLCLLPLGKLWAQTPFEQLQSAVPSLDLKAMNLDRIGVGSSEAQVLQDIGIDYSRKGNDCLGRTTYFFHIPKPKPQQPFLQPEEGGLILEMVFDYSYLSGASCEVGKERMRYDLVGGFAELQEVLPGYDFRSTGFDNLHLWDKQQEIMAHYPNYELSGRTNLFESGSEDYLIYCKPYVGSHIVHQDSWVKYVLLFKGDCLKLLFAQVNDDFCPIILLEEDGIGSFHIE